MLGWLGVSAMHLNSQNLIETIKTASLAIFAAVILKVSKGLCGDANQPSPSTQ